MNTMADGAAQRLVAQIGEALFGQPGLTLMELAEKVKQHDLSLSQTIGERDRYHEVADDLAGHIAAITGVDIGEHSSANCPWQNAIEAAEEYRPAQPSPATCKDGLQVQASPAGQGDALLEQVARFLDYSVGHDPWPNIRRAYGDAWWEPVGKMRDDLRALAARQPVGQEPVAFCKDRVLFWHGDHTAHRGDNYDLYAEANAQAVDLVQIIDQIAQQWDGCSYDAVGETIDIGQAIRSAGKRLTENKVLTNG